MVKLPRMKDRIHLKIDSVTFVFAPLSRFHKKEMNQHTNTVNGETVTDLFETQCLYIKHGLKEIKGITDYDGNDYELEFEGESLTDDCVSELLMLPQKEKMMTCAWQFLNEIPDKLVDLSTGKTLKGAKLEVKASKK